ncbi:MAG: UDP-3-O-(3-hydroxymyristoyl)glucosamine N-acyltransferase [Endomicrobiia bacterium]|nr:UDP-3-O-(3-hydroxymyristoyl)glucosamine N-acyltransferase [Endomicrobiia bacterium]
MIKITAAELAALVGGRVEGNPAASAASAAPIEDAGASDVTFVALPKYEKCIASTRASIIIVGKSYDFKDKTFVVVQNPLIALAVILERFASALAPRLASGVSAHSSVSPSATLGKNVFVGHFAVISDGAVVGDSSVIHTGCFVGEGAKIGRDCVLHPSVTIYGRCVLGDRVTIHAGTVIGSDGFGYIPSPAAVKSGIPSKIPQIGIVKIGDDVEIGSNTSIDRATMGATTIGDGTKIDNLVHIAHNVKIGRNCMLAAQVGFAGSATVGDGVMMAGQAGINGHIEIGAGAVIAGQSGVIGDVPPGQTVSGFPARPHAKMMRVYALMEKLPEMYDAFSKLKKK